MGVGPDPGDPADRSHHLLVGEAPATVCLEPSARLYVAACNHLQEVAGTDIDAAMTGHSGAVQTETRRRPHKHAVRRARDWWKMGDRWQGVRCTSR